MKKEEMLYLVRARDYCNFKALYSDLIYPAIDEPLFQSWFSVDDDYPFGAILVLLRKSDRFDRVTRRMLQDLYCYPYYGQLPPKETE